MLTRSTRPATRAARLLLVTTAALVLAPAVAAAQISDRVRQEAALFEKIAKAEKVSGKERRTLRAMLREADPHLATLAVWALSKIKDKPSLKRMAKRLKGGTKRVGFIGSAEQAFLRLAPLRIRGASRTKWATLLTKDRNAYVRAEAAKEVVLRRHPRALRLLRKAMKVAKKLDEPLRGAMLGQIAWSLGRLDRAGEPDLRLLLGEASYPRYPYGYVIELEQCQTLLKTPCGQLETYHMVDAYARRALMIITGRSWQDPKELK